MLAVLLSLASSLSWGISDFMGGAATGSFLSFRINPDASGHSFADVDAFVNAVPADLPMVEGDLDRLRQVFWNLLSNAVKFSEAGGSISVGGRTEADQVVVTVCDSGHGIEAEALPYIFDRFRQADGSSTRKYQGVGIGLALARDLVDAFGVPEEMLRSPGLVG